MNMGGGILLRTVARAAGSTTPAASSGFCSACTGQVACPSSLRTICRTCHHTALSQQAASSSNQVDLEDWEFADEAISESANRPFSSANALPFSHTPSVSSHSSAYLADDGAPLENQFWHVFGLPPSIEEANAATSELQAALFSSCNDWGGADEKEMMSSSCPSSSNAGASGGSDYYGGRPLTVKLVDEEADDEYSAWVEPPQLDLHVAKSPVEEAFQLLQSDPNVKGAVISIVSDPDVWHAMMKNKKVQELKRIFQKSQERGEDVEVQSDKHRCLDGVSFVLRSIVGLSRQVVWQVQDDISKIIMSIFSLVTRPKFDEDPFDKTMRSSMMIAVLVVTVVLMKRVQV